MPVREIQKAGNVFRLTVRVALWMLIIGVAAAQVPVVPTDHYGPPACAAAAHRTSVSAAKAEQTLGAEDAHALLSNEPMQNFGIERYKLEDYGECVGDEGCYWADLDAQYRRAEAALAAQVAVARAENHAGARLALVMDIDDTTLSSYCQMKAESFGYIGPMSNAWVVSPQAAVAIPGALRLFQEAKAAHVAVFFITGRPGISMGKGESTQADQTSATAKNLEAAGFHHWNGLVLRSSAENGMATIAYKSGERQKIVARGYTIVMSVGDQWSDLLGDPKASVSVKLPNPFYFLP